jgi:hypothetical protein
MKEKKSEVKAMKRKRLPLLQSNDSQKGVASPNDRAIHHQ